VPDQLVDGLPWPVQPTATYSRSAPRRSGQQLPVLLTLPIATARALVLVVDLTNRLQHGAMGARGFAREREMEIVAKEKVELPHVM
jgi:hypothetical protein